HVTHPKAPTDPKTKKKRILPSSKPKSPYKVRVILLRKHFAETPHAEVTVATADATKSLVASELAKKQVNQPSAAEAEKVVDKNIIKEKNVRVHSMEEPTFEQLMDKIDKLKEAAQEKPESPYDTESEINIIKSYQVNTISGLLFIHQGSQWSTSDDNVIDITPKDNEEKDTSDSDLRSMPSDD
nr:hypothetical protein [Tanacetum cinerariifolium]